MRRLRDGGTEIRVRDFGRDITGVVTDDERVRTRGASGRTMTEVEWKWSCGEGDPPERSLESSLIGRGQWGTSTKRHPKRRDSTNLPWNK